MDDFAVYPRVKVRDEQEEHVHISSPVAVRDQSTLLLQLVESLSITSHCRRPEKENRIKSPPSVAKISRACVSNSTLQTVSASKVKSNKQNGEDIKLSVRSTSVPRPRAVLSSPDNDDMIGSINKLSNDRLLAPNIHNSEKKTPARAGVCQIRIKAECPLSTGKASDKKLSNERSLVLKNHNSEQQKKTPAKARVCSSLVTEESPLSMGKESKEASSKKKSSNGRCLALKKQNSKQKTPAKVESPLRKGEGSKEASIDKSGIKQGHMWNHDLK